MEYSHSNLSPEAQNLLVCLAPFNSFFVSGLIPQYAEELQKHEAFEGYSFEQFDGAIQEAINWGLLSPHESGMSGLLVIQPIFPYFLRTKLKELNAATREALYEGFKAHYQDLAGSYQQLMNSKNPQERKLGLLFCRLEYENLCSALKFSLEKYEVPITQNCLATYFEVLSDYSSELSLFNFVCESLEKYPSERKHGKLGETIVRAFGQRANLFCRTQQYQQARKAYRQVLQALGEIDGIQSRQNNPSWLLPITS